MESTTSSKEKALAAYQRMLSGEKEELERDSGTFEATERSMEAGREALRSILDQHLKREEQERPER
jgi:hypothetical protein